MRKHATIDLDMELVRRAGDVLGTKRTTDTIHAALADVVRRRLRRQIRNLRPSLTLEDLHAMRDHRFDEQLDRVALHPQRFAWHAQPMSLKVDLGNPRRFVEGSPNKRPPSASKRPSLTGSLPG